MRARRPRRDRNGRRDEGRNVPPTHTAAPPRKAVALDPDSPFAKLSALREAMEKRTKEPSS